MFEYFPGNYVWNLGVVATLNSGGLIDEVDRACRPIREHAAQGADVGTGEFMAAWTQVTDQLEEQAAEAEKAGHRRTAGQKYLRAANYLTQAERMQSQKDPRRVATYQRCLDLMAKAFELGDPSTTRVEIPFGESSLPAYFTNASTDGAPVPVIVLWNGLDSTKEHMYTSGFQHELAARGISTLMVDCPGSGEALRLRGLTAQIDTEVWAAACVDYLEQRDDVRRDRIGLVGWSLGGYYAPRAAAYEKRLALCVAWGANHNWGAVQRRRLEREGENPVPHYWDHVLWVWGAEDVDSFITMADGVHLDGVVEQITVPFLIAHGENDRQIPLAYAQRSFDQATASPKRELRVFTPEEGATEHIGLDHLPHVATFIADWVSDTFGGAGMTVGAALDRTDPEGAIAATVARVSNWGRWGPDDVIGTMNFLTDERRAAAAGLVRRGAAFSLAQSFDMDGPQKGWRRRTNPIHTMLDTGTDAVAGVQGFPHGLGGADDVVSMPLQCSTQWDGLGHIFDHGRAWNGRRADRVVTSLGDALTGIETVADLIAGRGVLLDVGRVIGESLGTPGELPDGFAITEGHLRATIEAHGPTARVGTGDLVLVRTGRLARARREGWGDYAGGASPGLSFSTADWLHDTEIAGIATDTWGFEVRPNEFDEAFQPLHQVVIPNMGLFVGEMWDLEALATDCAADGVHDFFLTAAPIPVTGAVGAPVNPIAVK